MTEPFRFITYPAELVAEVVHDTKFWLPVVYTHRTTGDVMAHFALGLAGETGKFVAKICAEERPRNVDEAGRLLAEMLIYTAGLAGASEVWAADPSSAYSYGVFPSSAGLMSAWLSTASGDLAELTKKIGTCNEISDTCEMHKPGAHTAKNVNNALIRMFRTIGTCAEIWGHDLEDLYQQRRDVCVTKWGNPPTNPGVTS